MVLGYDCDEDDPEDDDKSDDTTLKQGIDNIAIKSNEQEESNELGMNITDKTEAETAQTELGNDKEFENIDSNKNDNSQGTLT